MNTLAGYQCSLCGKTFAASESLYTCPNDGGNLDVILDYDGIKRNTTPQKLFSMGEPSLWRYLPLLPVGDPGGIGTILRAAGGTPVYSPPLLMEEMHLSHFWIKDEGRNPTASFKDRASSVVLARSREIKAEVIVTASTGNAGAALAGMAAALGQRVVIFAPKKAPPAKIAQLLIYGAQVILVDGTYDEAFDLSIQASNEFGWYCRNTGYNSFTAEGKKTGAFEIWEQILVPNAKLTKRPYALFVPVGDGNIISGIHKGFKDLVNLGWLEQSPRIYGIQSEGSAAIANAYKAKTEKITPVVADTIADSISVDLPRDGVRALRAATQTGGAYLTVPDSQIIQAIGVLGRFGLFVEPAGATAFAGCQRAIKEGLVSVEDPIIVLNTGSGLKDIRSAMLAVKEAPVIAPSLAELKKHLHG